MGRTLANADVEPEEPQEDGASFARARENLQAALTLLRRVRAPETHVPPLSASRLSDDAPTVRLKP